MKKGMKRFFIICAIVAAVGLALAVCGFATGGAESTDKMSAKYDWILTDPGDLKYLEPVNEGQFHQVKVNGDIDVHISKHQTKTTRIGYRENMTKPQAYIKDGTLVIDAEKHMRKVSVNFSGKNEMPVVEIYCSEDKPLDTLDVNLDDGDIKVEGISAKNIKLCSAYGDISLDGISFDKGTIITEAGDIACRRVNSKGLKIQNHYGDCRLSGNFCGRNRIVMDSGDLDIETDLKENKYTIDAKTEAGDVCIGKYRHDGYENHYKTGSGPHRFEITSKYGDVNVGFCQKHNQNKKLDDGTHNQEQKKQRHHND